LCIYVQDMQTFSQVNIIGKVVSCEELDTLSDIRRGSKVIIRKKV